MLKNIVKNLEPSSTLKINEVSKLLEEKGKKIFKFGFGQSPFQILRYKEGHYYQRNDRWIGK